MHVFITTRRVRARKQIEQQERYREENWRGWRVTRSCHDGRRCLGKRKGGEEMIKGAERREVVAGIIRPSPCSPVSDHLIATAIVDSISWGALKKVASFRTLHCGSSCICSPTELLQSSMIWRLHRTQKRNHSAVQCAVQLSDEPSAPWIGKSSSEPSPSVGGVDFHCTGTAKSFSLLRFLPVLLSLLIRYFLHFWRQPAAFWAENGPTKILL